METDIAVDRRKRLKRAAVISLILGTVSFIWLIYNIPAVIKVHRLVSDAERLGMIVCLWVFFSIFFHLSVLITLLKMFRYFEKLQVMGLIASFFGIVSFLWLCLDWAALVDIGHDHLTGRFDCSQEFLALYTGFVPHILFHISVFAVIFKILRIPIEDTEIKSNGVDESLFVTINMIGLFCSGIGLVITLAFTQLGLPARAWSWAILPFCIATMMPYFIIIVYWLIGELKDRGHPLYDEKQRSDLTRAGITTWLISIPAMGILFLLDYAKIYSLESILCFPFYLFLTLLVFSGGTLCYFKKN